jgi:hypothetical protein
MTCLRFLLAVVKTADQLLPVRDASDATEEGAVAHQKLIVEAGRRPSRQPCVGDPLKEPCRALRRLARECGRSERGETD